MANPRHGYNPLNPLSLHSENRYREVFHSGASAALSEFIEQSAKEAGQEALEQAAKEGLDETTQKAIKEAVERATKEAGEKALQEAGETATEAGLKEAMQKATKESLQAQLKKDLAQQTVKDAAQASSRNMAKRFAGKGIGVGLGSAVGVGVFALAGILGSQALQGWMRSVSGLDCDEKALDAGYTAGDSDYTTFVEECQGRAETRMMLLGVSAIVVGGGVIFLLLK